MSNDPSYCNSPTNENSGDVEYAEGSFDETENFVEVGKYGEELLIELYKDRPCLYDQKDPNFKDISVKQSAWDEISKIMIESQCGNFALKCVAFFKSYTCFYLFLNFYYRWSIHTGLLPKKMCFIKRAVQSWKKENWKSV